MKKIIIIAAVIVSSALTAFCISGKGGNKTVVNINKASFAVSNLQAAKSDLATAD